jgi:hypothetical protein
VGLELRMELVLASFFLQMRVSGLSFFPPGGEVGMGCN